MVALILILYSQYTSKKKISVSSLSILMTVCPSDAAFRTKDNYSDVCFIMSIEAVTLAFHRGSFAIAVTG